MIGYFFTRKLSIIPLTSVLCLTSALSQAENEADDGLDDLMGGFDDEDDLARRASISGKLG